MSKVNLAITGCMGRMGQQLIKSSKTDKNFKLTTLTENQLINKKIAGIKLGLNDEKSLKNVDLIIDFTIPKCTFEILKIASKLKKRVVIGTTGFNKKDAVFKNIHGWKYSFNTHSTSKKSYWNYKYRLGICADWFVGPYAESAWISSNSLFEKIKKNPPRI